jgi:hypothetical protein
MDAEFKEGDEVYLKQDPGSDEHRKKFTIRTVAQTEAPEDAKRLSNEQPNGSLYGKEIEKISQPALSFIIQPIGGGRSINVSQGEIELIR